MAPDLDPHQWGTVTISLPTPAGDMANRVWTVPRELVEDVAWLLISTHGQPDVENLLTAAEVAQIGQRVAQAETPAVHRTGDQATA